MVEIKAVLRPATAARAESSRRLTLDGTETWATAEPLLRAYRCVLVGRELDLAELRLRRQRLSFFQVNCAGHEVVQAAVALHLRPGSDWFYPYYRDRCLVSALGVSVADMLRQSMGKATDPASGGRQMPAHYGSPRLHIVSQSSPTGTQYLQAVGTAEAGLLSRRLDLDGLPDAAADEIVYVSGGEGSTSQGEFYEAVSLASIRRLPVLFFIQDNEYAISVPVEEQTAGGSISRAFAGFPDLFVEEIDGLDFAASATGIARAVAHCRRGGGPALVHARVLRLMPHSDSDDDKQYRSAAELADVRARDPVPMFEEWLRGVGIEESGLDAVRSSVAEEIRQAIELVSTELEPGAETVERFVFADEEPIAGTTVAETGGDALSIVESVQRTLDSELAVDPRIVVFGEDVADASRGAVLDEAEGKGGVFKATRGLQRHHGSARVFNTPLAEASIVGRAIGLAVRGFRPVAEIQFLDYIWPAMQQIRNELGAMHWRSNGAFAAPVVLRVPTGGYLRGGGPYHSQSAESIFCRCPGLRVVLPSNARDACGLLRAAIRSSDPVLFLEHKHLYRQAYAKAPYPGDDYIVPLGRAACVRSGQDVTVVTYGALVEKSLRAADELERDEGCRAEVIDLRSLRPYDWPMVAESVRRTGRLVVASEEPTGFGYAAEIAARAAEELFEFLDAPVARVGAKETWVAYSPSAEEATLPQVADILQVVRRTVRY